MEKNKQRLAMQGLRLDSAAKQALLDYHWPGNIRELENMIERQETKRTLTLCGKPKLAHTVEHIAYYIIVAQHDAFRVACGARCIYDGE